MQPVRSALPPSPTMTATGGPTTPGAAGPLRSWTIPAAWANALKDLEPRTDPLTGHQPPQPAPPGWVSEAPVWLVPVPGPDGALWPFLVASATPPRGDLDLAESPDGPVLWALHLSPVPPVRIPPATLRLVWVKAQELGILLAAIPPPEA